jgi:hypothetical protein
MKELSLHNWRRTSKSVGFIVTILAIFNLHCTQDINFAGSKLTNAQRDESVLTAADLNLSTTVNVSLNVTKASILAAVTGAPDGAFLSLNSVSLPPTGDQWTDAGDHFAFLSAKVESVSLQYVVSDSVGDQAQGTINLKVVPSGNATGSYYACANGKLYQLSMVDQSVLSITPTTYLGAEIDFNDLAINATGDMYGKDKAQNGIYKVNVLTGVATQIIATVPNSTGELAGLTFISSSQLATFQSDGTILAFDINSLQTSTFEKTDYTMVGGDMKALPDGYIYWTVANASSKNCVFSTKGTQTLIRLNPTSGAAMEIGCLDQPSIYGLGFAHGNVYGFTGSGSILQINTATAHATVVGTSSYEFWGAASNPALW